MGVPFHEILYRRWVWRGWLWRLPAGNRSVSLTFDDGPHPETTPQLLDTLKRLGIPATHFVVGEKVRACPGAAQDIVASGQVLANHGFRHVSHAWWGTARQRRSIMQAETTLSELTLPFVRMFRPPYSRFNPMTRTALRSTRYHGVLWSVGIQDWIPQDADRLWLRLKTALHDGAVIVLHDGHPTTRTLVQILPRLAEEVSRRGWRFTPLPNGSTPLP